MSRNTKKYIKSPLNYVGGKYKLLPQLLPLFPKGIVRFVDMCCGGGNVGINVKAGSHFYVDNNEALIGILSMMSKCTFEELQQFITAEIEKYDLDTCPKEGGGYLTYRQAFNQLPCDYTSVEYCKRLFVLICYSYNNYMRFNANREFNMPYGERKFNISQSNNLKRFMDALHKQHCKFVPWGFNEFPYVLTENDFIYIDPPYLLGHATYNEKELWTEDDDRLLFQQLDEWTALGIRWGLSNVLEHKGDMNIGLRNWLRENLGRYYIHDIEASYVNCNAQRKNKGSITREIFVSNYEVG